MNISSLFFIYLLPLIAPTYLIGEQKKCIKDKKNEEHRKNIIKNLNTLYLSLTFLITLIFFIWPHWSKNAHFGVRFIYSLFLYYLFSRIIEIFFAFLTDSIDKMKNKPLEQKGLTYSERYMLALRSYLELILDYGIIFYIINTELGRHIFAFDQNPFRSEMTNIFESLYFSANNMTLLGYGDIYPTHLITQFLAVFQVITGAFLLIVTFTIYVTLNFTDNDSLKPKKRKLKFEREKTVVIIQVIIILILIITISII